MKLRHVLPILGAVIILSACKTSAPVTDPTITEASVTGDDPAELPDDAGTPAIDPAEELVCPTPYQEVDATSCEQLTPRGYGLSIDSPAEWGLGAGTQTLWFGRLMCGDGTIPTIFRAGSVGKAPQQSTSPSSQTHLGTLDVVDLWMVQCPGDAKPTEIYHNLYRCGSPCAPSGFSLMPAEAYRAYVASLEASDNKDNQRARALALRAYELAPDFELSLMWHAIQEAQAGELTEALALFERAEALNPSAAFARMQRAHILLQLSRYEEARVVTLTLMTETQLDDPDYPEVLCLHAGALLSTDADQARALATEACSLGEKECC